MSEKYENRTHVERFQKDSIMDSFVTKHGEQYLEYRDAWEKAERGDVIPNIPLHVELNLTSYCNLRCKMCFRSADNPNNPKNHMPLEMVKKIALEIKELGIPALALGEGSEGLLHPETDRIIDAFSNVGLQDYFVMTNGLLLNDRISNQMIKSGVDRLNISIDAATGETYKKIRGGDLTRLEHNIDDFLRIRGNGTFPILRVSFVKQKDNIEEARVFLDKWKDKADIVDFQDYVEYGNVDNLIQIPDKIDYVCPLPFTKLCIRWNGDIYPCTNPYQKYFKIGNINHISIKEAWNSDVIRNLRKKMLERDMPMACKNCRGSRFFSNVFESK